MSTKPGIFTRVKHALFGKPVTHEEQQAARGQTSRGDSMAQAQMEARNQRFHAGGF